MHGSMFLPYLCSKILVALMKKYIAYIISFCMLCVVACRPEAEPRPESAQMAYPTILKEINRLADVDADHAMHLIDSIDAEMAHASEPVQMYYKLLTVKVQERQGVPHSSSGMMRSVLDYYEQQENSLLLPEAYYYMGCTYRDLKVYGLALENFQKAMDFAIEAGDAPQISHLYSEMGALLAKQELYDNALYAFRQAYRQDSLRHHVPGMVYALRDIGLVHRERRTYDSAYYYFHRAERIAKVQGDLLLRNVAALEIADLLTDRRQYDQAWETLQPVLARLTPENRGKANLIAAQIFRHTYRYEKVPPYASEVMLYGNYAEKAAVCSIMAQIAHWRKDYEEYGRYTLQYADYKTRGHDGETAAVMAEMNSLYNYQQALKENAALAQKGERKSQTIALLVGIIAVLTLLALIAYMFYLRKRDAMRAKLHELENDQKEQKRAAERSVAEKMERISTLENLLQQSGSENSTLRQHVEEMQLTLNRQVATEMQLIRVRDGADKELKDTKIYHRIIYLINNKRLLSHKDYEQLRDTFEALYPDFMKQLLELCEMSDLEIEVSLLRRMGVSPNDIASLTDYSKPHISGVRGALYTKAFGIKGAPSDWDNFIASL